LSRGGLDHPVAPQTQRRRAKKRNLVSFSYRSAPGEGIRDPSAHSKPLPDMHFSRTCRPGETVTRITLLVTRGLLAACLPFSPVRVRLLLEHEQKAASRRASICSRSVTAEAEYASRPPALPSLDRLCGSSWRRT